MSYTVAADQTVTVLDSDGGAVEVTVPAGPLERTVENAAAVDFLLSAGIAVAEPAHTRKRKAPDEPATTEQPGG